MCHGLRGHDRIKESMCDVFEDEYVEASREVDRLRALFKEVCWYNFETKCRSWMHPWPYSLENSLVELHGTRIVVDDSRGRRREIGHFPVYYSGVVRDAPELPPQILLIELKLASDHLAVCKKQRNAPFDWAPGGRLYKQLLRETSVPSEHAKKRARAQEAADRISRRMLKHHGNGGRDESKSTGGGSGLQQCNDLGRATDSHAQETCA